MSKAAAGAERPLCPCHGRPMYWANRVWECAAASNYRRARNRRRKRIAKKRALLEQLEPHAQEDV